MLILNFDFYLVSAKNNNFILNDISHEVTGGENTHFRYCNPHSGDCLFT